MPPLFQMSCSNASGLIVGSVVINQGECWLKVSWQRRIGVLCFKLPRAYRTKASLFQAEQTHQAHIVSSWGLPWDQKFLERPKAQKDKWFTTPWGKITLNVIIDQKAKQLSLFFSIFIYMWSLLSSLLCKERDWILSLCRFYVLLLWVEGFVSFLRFFFLLFFFYFVKWRKIWKSSTTWQLPCLFFFFF